MLTGFWMTVVFLLNAFIFVQVGVGFHQVELRCTSTRPGSSYGGPGPSPLSASSSGSCGRSPRASFAGDQRAGARRRKADWSHVTVVAWTGMRGGVSFAAAFAIPLETAAGPFPFRDLLIFITFVVLLATLVGQGGTLPFLIRKLGVTDDGAAEAEECGSPWPPRRKPARSHRPTRSAKAWRHTAILELHRRRLATRWAEFGETVPESGRGARTSQYREITKASARRAAGEPDSPSRRRGRSTIRCCGAFSEIARPANDRDHGSATLATPRSRNHSLSAGSRFIALRFWELTFSRRVAMSIVAELTYTGQEMEAGRADRHF